MPEIHGPRDHGTSVPPELYDRMTTDDEHCPDEILRAASERAKQVVQREEMNQARRSDPAQYAIGTAVHVTAAPVDDTSSISCDTSSPGVSDCSPF